MDAHPVSSRNMQRSNLHLTVIRKIALLILVLGLLFSPTLYVMSVTALNIAMPVTADSLEYQPIELGRIETGIQVPIACLIRNRSSRAIRLSQPVTSCGCVMAEQGPDVLPAGETAELRFRYQSPGRPGKIDRQVVLTASDFPAVSWTIPIRGEVAAAIWSDPATIELETDSSGTAEVIVKIHHNRDVAIGEIRADTDEVQIESLPDQNNVLPVKIRVVNSLADRRTLRTATIRFLSGRDDKNDEIFRLPVRWKLASKIDCSPAKVTLRNYGRAVGNLKQTILIRGLDESERDRLGVLPLKDWLRVTDRRTVGNFVHLQLTFDPAAMPERIDDDILQLNLDDTDSVTVSATGGRQ